MSKFGVSAENPSNAKKPLPYVASFSSPFWEGTKMGELRIQSCKSCGHKQFPPKSSCESCMKRDFDWVKSTGSGRIYSFASIKEVVMNSPAFQKDLPYFLAAIDLEEQVRIIAQIVECDPNQIREGMQVKAFFEDIGGISIVKFRPALPIA